MVKEPVCRHKLVTVTTDCLMVHRIVRLNLNWKKIIVQLLQFINL